MKKLFILLPVALLGLMICAQSFGDSGAAPTKAKKRARKPASAAITGTDASQIFTILASHGLNTGACASGGDCDEKFTVDCSVSGTGADGGPTTSCTFTPINPIGMR